MIVVWLVGHTVAMVSSVAEHDILIKNNVMMVIQIIMIAVLILVQSKHLVHEYVILLSCD